MSAAKLKRMSKSKRSSPRLYDTADLPQFMLLQARSGYPESRGRRPKSEILRELRRLRAGPLRLDDEEELVAPAPAKPVRTLDEFDALRLTRHRIKQLLRSTSFEQAVRNCFVRLNISALNVPPEYRIAEILGVEELPVGYYVDKTPTNIVLHLRYDDLVEKHELNDLSNMAFTREEFELWRDNCVCQAIEWPTTELVARKKIELYNALNSEGKLTTVLQQNGLVSLAMPMRPAPRAGLLERFGGVYPWKLQRPATPSPSPTPPAPETSSDGSSDGSLASAKPELELETLNEELEAQRLDSIMSSAEHKTKIG
ncbi:RNA polymerase-associated protein Rtf1 [Drosophila innubila]|uniref:RNA polymerase-associated protein Rtf1 n=1 Tax=Drosophila innubila TaxID=198719 RepID=UPI00148BB697|nr:RNA polymerase-associated protein Rtf1 [Drosophila innubila]